MSMEENSNPNQNPYDEYQDPNIEQPPDGNGKKPGRTFLTILAIVGSIFVLAIIILIAFVVINRNRTATRFQQQAATINAENTAVAQVASETAAVLIQRMTEKAMPPTWTLTSAAIATATRTSTPLPPTRTATQAVAVDSAARTSTVAAFLTQVAQKTTVTNATATKASAANATATKATTLIATATKRTGTTTALPSTGFAEDVGLPGLFGTALALVAIIILARKLRLSTHS